MPIIAKYFSGSVHLKHLLKKLRVAVVLIQQKASINTSLRPRSDAAANKTLRKPKELPEESLVKKLWYSLYQKFSSRSNSHYCQAKKKQIY